MLGRTVLLFAWPKVQEIYHRDLHRESYRFRPELEPDKLVTVMFQDFSAKENWNRVYRVKVTLGGRRPRNLCRKFYEGYYHAEKGYLLLRQSFVRNFDPDPYVLDREKEAAMEIFNSPSRVKTF